MESNRSLQGRLKRHRLALPPQRPPPKDPFQDPSPPGLSLVLEDNVEVIEPFVQPGPAKEYLREDIHKFNRSIETNEIPKEHIEKYYIPHLTRNSNPKDKIAREVIEWIEERVNHAKERGFFGTDFWKTYDRIIKNVAKTYKERIEKIKEQEQELKKKIEELRNIENNINDILNKINTTIQGCIKKKLNEDECLELQELKEKHKKYTSNKEEIVESIRLTYDEYNES